MKKRLIVLLLTLLLPINVLGYSNYIIPGGKSVGIEINTDGIMIVGFYKVDGKTNRGNPELRVGDRITKVNDEKVTTVKELISKIDENMSSNQVKLSYLRDNKENTTTLDLIYENDTYKTGLYVKDSITGIGTITYIDPSTKVFGALGHEIIESNSNEIVDVKTGKVFRSVITSIDRSVSGTPGGKNAKFYSNTVYGDIDKNGITGIYGNYTSSLENEKTLPIASLDEVKKGSAKIYTVLDGEEVGEYDIEITKIDSKNEIKNIYFEVKDKELLERTGGIVQGMSGSPIIQDGKIIGAVTHVVVSNPASGYGISIIKMLEDGEK